MSTASLLPFQHTGSWHLATRRRALLADQQRVGKTPQAVHACDLVGADSILVGCPAIARPGWLREFTRFSDREGAAIVTAKDPVHPRLTVVSYDLMADPAVYARLSRNWDAVVLDECHLLCNLATNRAQAAYGLANGAAFAWSLSGTPAPNHMAELWAMLYSYGVTKLDYWAFLNLFCIVRMTPFGAKPVGVKNQQQLRDLLKGFMLRRTLAEVAPDMPPMRWSPLPLEPGDVADFYTKEELAAARAQEPEMAAALALAGEDIEDLGEAARDFRRLLGLQKVKPLAELISDELNNGMENVVIFAWHRDVIKALAYELRSYGSAEITGATSPMKKQERLEAFRAGIKRVLVAQIIAAGTAIDVSCCDDLIFAESDYVPANNSQAAMRCTSQFKKSPVRVRVSCVADSHDETIQNINLRKLKGLAGFFG